MTRGPASIIVTKVKGHAKEEQVQAGEIGREDRDGNDMADKAAEEGIGGYRKGTLEYLNWMQNRRTNYQADEKHSQGHHPGHEGDVEKKGGG